MLSLHYPLTMARYFENALRAREDVELTTVGRYSGTFIPWMGGMHLPEKYKNPPNVQIPQSVPRDYPYQLLPKEVKETNWDMIITVDAGLHWSVRPDSDAKIVHVATDPHVLKYDKPRAYSDFFFNMQKAYMNDGNKDIYLPYAFDDTWCYHDASVEKINDGALIGMPYKERQELVNRLKTMGYSVLFENGPIFDEYRMLNNSAFIGLNWSSLNDLVCRVFEIMGLGLVPVINRVPDLKLHFVEGKHYLGFSGLEEAIEKFVWAMDNKEEAQKIANNARELVEKNHTFKLRVQQIMETVFPEIKEQRLKKELGYG